MHAKQLIMPVTVICYLEFIMELVGARKVVTGVSREEGLQGKEK